VKVEEQREKLVGNEGTYTNTTVEASKSNTMSTVSIVSIEASFIGFTKI
jgi:hypothetical protein